MDAVNIQRLQKTLDFLESKQREFKKEDTNNARSIGSFIKYFKKDIVEQFQLIAYDASIKEELNNTESFIRRIQKIINIQTDLLKE